VRSILTSLEAGRTDSLYRARIRANAADPGPILYWTCAANGGKLAGAMITNGSRGRHSELLTLNEAQPSCDWSLCCGMTESHPPISKIKLAVGLSASHSGLLTAGRLRIAGYSRAGYTPIALTNRAAR
jgi:hypothetical protein